MHMAAMLKASGGIPARGNTGQGWRDVANVADQQAASVAQPSRPDPATTTGSLVAPFSAFSMILAANRGNRIWWKGTSANQ